MLKLESSIVYWRNKDYDDSLPITCISHCFHSPNVFLISGMHIIKLEVHLWCSFGRTVTVANTFLIRTATVWCLVSNRFRVAYILWQLFFISLVLDAYFGKKNSVCVLYARVWASDACFLWVKVYIDKATW